MNESCERAGSSSMKRLPRISVMVLGLVVGIALGPLSKAVAAPNVSNDRKSLDIVILVDESASLSKQDVQDEVRAVADLVSRRELSGDEFTVRVAIAGFGSGPLAVDEKCALEYLTRDKTSEFVDCAGKVRRRGSDGQHTDFASALQYASDVFRSSSPAADARAVILLTDGKYDPAGDRQKSGVSPEETSRLRAAADELQVDSAQIWPLGFGDVSREELDDLAERGAASTCPAGQQPYAIVAQGQSLGSYLLQIIGATICVGFGGAVPIPYDFEVHPFVDDVTLTVRGSDDDPVVEIARTGKRLCEGQWSRARDGSLSCRVQVSGGDVGLWKITSAVQRPDAKPTVETSQSGFVDLELKECDSRSVTVQVRRVDGTPIVWEPGIAVSYPQITLVNATSSAVLGQVALSQSTVKVPLRDASTQIAIDVAVELSEGQKAFIWLKASRDTCKLEVENGTTPTTVVVEDGGTDTTPPPPPPLSLKWLILALAAIAALVWWLRRRKKMAVFPMGAELRQRNTQANRASAWNTRADLGDAKEMGFVLDPNGWLVEADPESADLVVRRLRKRQTGDFLVVQPARQGSQDGVNIEGAEAVHTFNFASDPGNGISFRNTHFRIEVPEDDLAEEPVDSD